jgi:hypothetical protein
MALINHFYIYLWERSGCWPKRSPKRDINRNQLTIHADNGSSMASKPVAFLLADLGVKVALLATYEQ